MSSVDLALVLAFDGSASVTYEEFGLIAGGCAAALRDPVVSAGLIGGPLGGSLCSVLLWSGQHAQDVLIDWTRVGTPAELDALSRAVEDVSRTVQPGNTAIGSALLACEALFSALPATARRSMIDVAGDGRSNDGPPPEEVRDRLVAAGVTINGLCVLHEEPDLVQSYTREVIGGPDAFALACQDYSGFADAMQAKAAAGGGLNPRARSAVPSLCVQTFIAEERSRRSRSRSGADATDALEIPVTYLF